MEYSNKLKVNEYVSINQLKRKIKAYLIDQGNSEFKPSVFAQGLVLSLVMVLEELVTDCIKNVVKDKTGLYTINMLVLKNLLYESDKYNFALKYLRKYSGVTRYHDSVFFNIHKVMDNLETKLGSKLMIDTEPKNMICYLILYLQYDILDLSVKMIKYANRKTLNNSVLEIVYSYMLSDEISSKIKLRIDSYNICIEEGEAEDSGEENIGEENVGEEDVGEEDVGEEDVGEEDDEHEDDESKENCESKQEVKQEINQEVEVEEEEEVKKLVEIKKEKKDKKNSKKEMSVETVQKEEVKNEIIENEIIENEIIENTAEKKIEKELVDDSKKKNKKNNKEK